MYKLFTNNNREVDQVDVGLTNTLNPVYEYTPGTGNYNYDRATYSFVATTNGDYTKFNLPMWELVESTLTSNIKAEILRIADPEDLKTDIRPTALYLKTNTSSGEVQLSFLSGQVVATTQSPAKFVCYSTDEDLTSGERGYIGGIRSCQVFTQALSTKNSRALNIKIQLTKDAELQTSTNDLVKFKEPIKGDK